MYSNKIELDKEKYMYIKINEENAFKLIGTNIISNNCSTKIKHNDIMNYFVFTKERFDLYLDKHCNEVRRIQE